ncbi:MAG: shikimate dehydrogenase [Chlamydiales bacterium]|nr:shikimate dehydrogenase [Chlamydiales bacterium]
MLFVIVNSLEDTHALLSSLPEEVAGIELRLDRFKTIDFADLKRVKTLSPLPLLFTLRKKRDGGSFEGDDGAHSALIEQLIELSPDYFDLEHDTPQLFLEKLSEKYPHTKILLSYHNFEETPELAPLLQKMRSPYAYGYKIACKARSSLDALRMSVFITKQEENLTGISMGRLGEFTRITAPVAGSLFNYTFLDVKSAFEGQLSLATLHQTYRYTTLSPSTALFGLIGDPVDQSISHLTHNKRLREIGADGVYIKISLKTNELPEFLTLARQLPFKGLSVTMPHKEAILPLLDELSEEARAIQAVNTLIFKNGRIRGENTDGLGALDLLGPVEGKRLVILGAGGTALAIAYEAKRRGGEVLILNRTPARAERAASQLSCEGDGMEKIEEIFKRGYEILINATPVGMPPNDQTLPIDPRWILPGSMVMDVVSTPGSSLGMTPLLQEAQKRGCMLMSGKALFFAQAAHQFKLWFA